jgi:cell division protein FtsB
MDNETMDKVMEQVGILGRRLMEIQKVLSDVAWNYDSLVLQYAQLRQKEEQEKAKAQTKKAPEKEEKK